MATKPGRNEIALLVLKKLQGAAENFGSAPAGGVTEKDASGKDVSLSRDLDLPPLVITALAKPYTTISRTYTGGLRVSQDDAKKARTVTKAIDLVHSRANGVAKP